jgi:hypothetical protein
MRIVAGHDKKKGNFFLRRADVEPPPVFSQQIWPWIEGWEARFRAQREGRKWEEGGVDKEDKAAVAFLKLLKRLRIVLLQDAAILQRKFPQMAILAHRVFATPE